MNDCFEVMKNIKQDLYRHPNQVFLLKDLSEKHNADYHNVYRSVKMLVVENNGIKTFLWKRMKKRIMVGYIPEKKNI